MEKPRPEHLGIFGKQEYVYGLLIAFFIFYLVSGNWIFGLLVGLSLVWAVVLEFWAGASQRGVKNEIKETLIALILALAVWYGAGFALGTPTPINAIVSCSMLPHIQRGDMVILSGGGIGAPTADADGIAQMGYDAEVFRSGQLVSTVKGSLYSHCSQHAGSALCNQFITNPSEFSEKRGPLAFGYEKCGISVDGGGKQVGPCVSFVEAGGVRYRENLSNDVVVYGPPSGELYSRVGDIIHRAFVKVRSDGLEYILTKGDNNPVFDMQIYDERVGMGNKPVEFKSAKGKVVVRIPAIGYLKLFISPSAIVTPQGCDRHYSKYDG